MKRARARTRRITSLALLAFLALPAPPAQAREPGRVTSPRIDLSIDVSPLEALWNEVVASKHSVDAVVYKFDAKLMREVISDGVERGLEVRIVADEAAAKGKRSFLRRVVKSGAQVRLWKSEKLHAKFVILDSRRVVTGSFNWTRSADQSNVELVIRYEDPVVAERFSQLFLRLWEDAKPFDPK